MEFQLTLILLKDNSFQVLVLTTPSFQVHLLEKLKGHPNIIQIHGHQAAWDTLMVGIVLELADCDFLHVLRQKIFLFREDLFTVLHCFAQMVDAVEAVHHAGIVHFDLKPENFLVGAAAAAVHGILSCVH